MEYRCRRIAMVSLIPNHMTFIMPLCTNCATKDCTNPIETRKVSILGIPKDLRVFVRSGDITFVAECDGFTI